MLLDDFNHTLDRWIEALAHYNINKLCAKPAHNSWSIGQLYMHILAETSYYVEQIKICVSVNDNASEEASAAAKSMFLNNDFPNETIEGNPNAINIPQPSSKEQLIDNLMHLKNAMNEPASLISKTNFCGKTKHPGLHYFSANEWLQFAEMHLRHHVRQKNRIDNFLKKANLYRDI